MKKYIAPAMKQRADAMNITRTHGESFLSFIAFWFL